MTDNEIKKALECCDGSFDKCGECPLDNVNQDKLRCWELEKSALDLINRLQAKVEFYKKNRDKYQDGVMFLSIQVDELQAENERLKNALTDHEYGNCVAVKNGLIYTHTLEDYDELIGDISAEAYKECIEKVKEYIDTYEHLACEECECVPISKETLDNLLKEKVGE